MACLTLSLTPLDRSTLQPIPVSRAHLSVTPLLRSKLTVTPVCTVGSGTLVVLASLDGPLRTRDGGYILLDPSRE